MVSVKLWIVLAFQLCLKYTSENGNRCANCRIGWSVLFCTDEDIDQKFIVSINWLEKIVRNNAGAVVSSISKEE